MRENLESFLALAEEEGRPVPLFVEEECNFSVSPGCRGRAIAKSGYPDGPVAHAHTTGQKAGGWFRRT